MQHTLALNTPAAVAIGLHKCWQHTPLCFQGATGVSAADVGPTLRPWREL